MGDVHEQTLRLFKRRAEDIFRCELAQRDDMEKIGQQLKIDFEQNHKTGVTRIVEMRWIVPPREHVAYALTLIRPLTVRSDRLAWRKVLEALTASCRDDDSVNKRWIEELRTAWCAYPFRRMKIMQGSIDPASQEPRVDAWNVDAWDNEIARKFLYGDLVHGDDNAALLDALGEPTVLFAASAMASDGFKLVNNTYEVMHGVRSDIAPEHAYFSKRFHEREAEHTAPSPR